VIRAEPAPGGRASARWLASPLLLLLAACTAQATPGPSAADQPSPFADCTALTAPPTPTAAPDATAPNAAAPSAGGASGAGAGGGTGLPNVVLPCFTGGQQVRLADLRGPAVVNLWGSWCGPCRAELPAVQRLADRTAGRLHVIGVDTYDDRAAGASFGTDKNITVPTLFDPDKRLLTGLGKADLPVTVFLDAAGMPYVYHGTGLDDAALATLVTRHAGVTVAP
jgi:cytochrome c biogenesis protein CcmG/thiol:disulfide interchange protein DsbE